MAFHEQIQDLNPLDFGPVTNRVRRNNPRLKRRTNKLWDEAVTGRRARAFTVEKTVGENYRPLI